MCELGCHYYDLAEPMNKARLRLGLGMGISILPLLIFTYSEFRYNVVKATRNFEYKKACIMIQK